MEKKQLKEYMDTNKKVLNKAVGFDHHTLAIAAMAASLRIKELENVAGIGMKEWQKKVKSLFLSLWDKAVENKSNYDKEQWIEFQKLLDRVLR